MHYTSHFGILRVQNVVVSHLQWVSQFRIQFQLEGRVNSRLHSVLKSDYITANNSVSYDIDLPLIPNI